MIWFYRLYTEEEFCQVVKSSPRERIVIFTSCILDSIITLVVEHLIGCKVQGSIQERKSWKKPSKATKYKCFNESNYIKKLYFVALDGFFQDLRSCMLPWTLQPMRCSTTSVIIESRMQEVNITIRSLGELFTTWQNSSSVYSL
jgi:hypothetical protein